MTQKDLHSGIGFLYEQIRRVGTLPNQIIMRADAFTSCLSKNFGWSNKDTNFFLFLLLSNHILEMNDTLFLKLTEHGYGFINDVDQQNLYLYLHEYIFANLKNLRKEQIFYHLWEIIGNDKGENPYYVDGPTFFYLAKKYIPALPNSYSQYDKDLKEQAGKTVSRSIWGKDLFLKLSDNEIASFLEDLSEEINKTISNISLSSDDSEGEKLKEIKQNILEDQSNDLNITMQQEIKTPRIFIVHGHDEAKRLEVELLIKGLGYEPVVLFKQPNQGATIIEKLEKETNDVAFAIVLYTKCDEGKAIGENEYKPRARQNVVFEHGMVCGVLGRKRVVALREEGVEWPGDLTGIVYIDIDSGGAWKLLLAKEMKAAGLEIDMNKLL